jgi:hypothetical protein
LQSGATDRTSPPATPPPSPPPTGRSPSPQSNTGPQDLIAWHHASTGSNPDRGFVQRDIDIPTGGSVGTVDFGGSDSFTPATATITVVGGQAGDAVNHGMSYWSTGSCYLSAL